MKRAPHQIRSTDLFLKSTCPKQVFQKGQSPAGSTACIDPAAARGRLPGTLPLTSRPGWKIPVVGWGGGVDHLYCVPSLGIFFCTKISLHIAGVPGQFKLICKKEVPCRYKILSRSKISAFVPQSHPRATPLGAAGRGLRKLPARRGSGRDRFHTGTWSGWTARGTVGRVPAWWWLRRRGRWARGADHPPPGR